MNRLRKFLLLPAAERWFLVKVALLLETIKLAMWLLPFRVLRRLADAAGKVPAGLQPAEGFSVERIARNVEMLSWHTPGEKTCLNQALAMQVLLSRRGYPALLHIGAFKNENGEFLAHAWVECEGKVVIGGHELERYTPLATLKGAFR